MKLKKWILPRMKQLYMIDKYVYGDWMLRKGKVISIRWAIIGHHKNLKKLVPVNFEIVMRRTVRTVTCRSRIQYRVIWMKVPSVSEYECGDYGTVPLQASTQGSLTLDHADQLSGVSLLRATVTCFHYIDKLGISHSGQWCVPNSLMASNH